MKDKYQNFISVVLCMWFMILIYDDYMWSMIMVYDGYMWFMILIYDGCVWANLMWYVYTWYDIIFLYTIWYDMFIHNDLIKQLVWLVVTGSKQDCRCTLLMGYQWGMMWIYFNLFWI